MRPRPRSRPPASRPRPAHPPPPRPPAAAGDSVLVRSAVAADADYVAHVVSLPRPPPGGAQLMEVAWLYRPEDVPGGRRAFHGARELLLSDHRDLVDAEAVAGRVRVVPLETWVALAEPRPEDLFFQRFFFRAATKAVEPASVAAFCVCRMPYNPDLEMVACRECGSWAHPACVGAGAARPYLCDGCAPSDGTAATGKSA